eukprot:scaffold86895_cov34-Prasinocladus_malaysianus.AAC.4
MSLSVWVGGSSLGASFPRSGLFALFPLLDAAEAATSRCRLYGDVVQQVTGMRCWGRASSRGPRADETARRACTVFGDLNAMPWGAARNPGATMTLECSASDVCQQPNQRRRSRRSSTESQRQNHEKTLSQPGAVCPRKQGNPGGSRG